MSKKKMQQTYLPARLIKTKNHRGNDKWFIKYYQTDLTGVRKMHRSTHELNRIIDLEERERIACQIIEEINKKLYYGYPYQDRSIKKNKSKKIKVINILDGIEKAYQIKKEKDGHNTNLSRKSIKKIFIEFLKIAELEQLNINEFSKSNLVQYIDYLQLDRGVGNVTVNNNISSMKSMFNELLKRNYLKKNRFAKVKKEKIKGKLRRAFTEKERRIVIEHLEAEAKKGTIKARKVKLLIIAIKLEYHCLIRPTELLKLKFCDFNLDLGIIRMSSEISKNNNNEIITIPDSLSQDLQGFIESYPKHFLIFGKNGIPHLNQASGKNILGNWMRKELQYLHHSGQLHSIRGLSLYSWKDTGIMELFSSGINILEIMKQARHKDLKTTQMYCQSLYYINKQIKTLSNPILPITQSV